MIKRSKSKDRVPLLDRLVNFHLRKCEEPFQGQKKRSGHTEALQSGIQMEGRKTALGRVWTGENKETPRYQAERLNTAVFRWSEWRDLNSRPLDPQSSALPAAPHPDNVVYYTGRFRKMQALFSNFLKKFCKGPSSPQKHWAEGHLLLVYIVAGGAGFTPGRQLGAAPPALLGSLGKEPILLHQLFQAVPQGQQL